MVATVVTCDWAAGAVLTVDARNHTSWCFLSDVESVCAVPPKVAKGARDINAAAHETRAVSGQVLRVVAKALDRRVLCTHKIPSTERSAPTRVRACTQNAAKMLHGGGLGEYQKTLEIALSIESQRELVVGQLESARPAHRKLRARWQQRLQRQQGMQRRVQSQTSARLQHLSSTVAEGLSQRQHAVIDGFLAEPVRAPREQTRGPPCVTTKYACWLHTHRCDQPDLAWSHL